MWLRIGTGLFGYVSSTKPFTVYLSMGALQNTCLLLSPQNHTWRLTMITVLCYFPPLIFTFFLSVFFVCSFFVCFSLLGDPWSGAVGRDPLVGCGSGAEARCD